MTGKVRQHTIHLRPCFFDAVSITQPLDALELLWFPVCYFLTQSALREPSQDSYRPQELENVLDPNQNCVLATHLSSRTASRVPIIFRPTDD